MDRAPLAALLGQYSSVLVKDNVLEVLFGSGRGFFVTSIQDKDLRAVERAASEVLGRETKVRFAEEGEAAGGPIRPGRELESAMKDPAVKFFMDKFKAQVLSADPIQSSRDAGPKGRGPTENDNMKNVMDIQKMMKAAKEMQDRLQQELAALRVEGSSGGGMVGVVLDGHKALQSIRIDPEVVNRDEVEMLQDLVVAAFNDAAAKVDESLAQKLGALGGGLKIPGLG